MPSQNLSWRILFRFAIDIIDPQCCDEIITHISWLKIMARLYYIVAIIAVEELAMQIARDSATLGLTWFSLTIP